MMKQEPKPQKEHPVHDPDLRDEPVPVITGGLTSQLFASVELPLEVQRQLAQHHAAEKLAD